MHFNLFNEFNPSFVWMFNMSLIWLVELLQAGVCAFNMVLSFFQHFIDFWHNKPFL